MKDFIGGVILFDETIRQKTTLGINCKHGGPIKVDKGTISRINC